MVVVQKTWLSKVVSCVILVKAFLLLTAIHATKICIFPVLFQLPDAKITMLWRFKSWPEGKL